MHENKYNFNKIKLSCDFKSSFYCYFGCCVFKSRKELMEHLCDHHKEKDLKAWGLNRSLLLKFLKDEDDKRLSKRKRKSNAKNESKG
jgi:hypothetical protein